MAEFGYERLTVWQKGMDLVESVYLVTRDFPREEVFGLTSQLRRAAVSIPANIAEGYGRKSKVSFAHFARISQGSLYELRTELQIAKRTGIAPVAQIDPLLTNSVELSRILDGFIRSLERGNDLAGTANS